MNKKKDSGIGWLGEIPEHWFLEHLQWHIFEIKEINKRKKRNKYYR